MKQVVSLQLEIDFIKKIEKEAKDNYRTLSA